MNSFLPFLLLGGLLISFRRAFLRTLVSIFTLFIALVVAALLYTPLLTWFTGATSSLRYSRLSDLPVR